MAVTVPSGALARRTSLAAVPRRRTGPIAVSPVTRLKYVAVGHSASHATVARPAWMVTAGADPAKPSRAGHILRGCDVHSRPGAAVWADPPYADDRAAGIILNPSDDDAPIGVDRHIRRHHLFRWQGRPVDVRSSRGQLNDRSERPVCRNMPKGHAVHVVDRLRRWHGFGVPQQPRAAVATGHDGRLGKACGGDRQNWARDAVGADLACEQGRGSVARCAPGEERTAGRRPRERHVTGTAQHRAPGHARSVAGQRGRHHITVFAYPRQHGGSVGERQRRKQQRIARERHHVDQWAKRACGVEPAHDKRPPRPSA